jgi:hypothetical protein
MREVFMLPRRALGCQGGHPPTPPSIRYSDPVLYYQARVFHDDIRAPSSSLESRESEREGKMATIPIAKCIIVGRAGSTSSADTACFRI